MIKEDTHSLSDNVFAKYKWCARPQYFPRVTIPSPPKSGKRAELYYCEAESSGRILNVMVLGRSFLLSILNLFQTKKVTDLCHFTLVDVDQHLASI